MIFTNDHIMPIMMERYNVGTYMMTHAVMTLVFAHLLGVDISNFERYIRAADESTKETLKAAYEIAKKVIQDVLSGREIKRGDVSVKVDEVTTMFKLLMEQLMKQGVIIESVYRKIGEVVERMSELRTDIISAMQRELRLVSNVVRETIYSAVNNITINVINANVSQNRSSDESARHVSADAPEFLKDNPYVGIIRNKYLRVHDQRI